MEAPGKPAVKATNRSSDKRGLVFQSGWIDRNPDLLCLVLGFCAPNACLMRIKAGNRRTVDLATNQMQNFQWFLFGVLNEVWALKRVAPEEIEVVYVRIFDVEHDERFAGIRGAEKVHETVQQSALHGFSRKKEFGIFEAGLFPEPEKGRSRIPVLRNSRVADLSRCDHAAHIGEQRSQQVRARALGSEQQANIR